MVLGPFDASYMSFLRTNNFHCVFRYYYDVNANTVYQLKHVFWGTQKNRLIETFFITVSTTYTQKKKFSQYLCFLIKSTILDISLSNLIHELYNRNFTRTCYCVTNNASIRLYQPNFKMHDVHVLR